MPQIPENIRPTVALIAKHHFWLLAILVPLLLLPLLFAARGGLQTQISASQSQIRGKLDAVQSVRAVEPHPNAGWSTEIDADAARIRRDTLAEWQKFWDSQNFLRVWPEELGPDFLKAVATLKPDGRLDRNLLQRYQNTIPEIVRKLPARMGADEAMGDDRDAGPGPGSGGERGGDRERRSQALVTWNAEDQRRLLRSFEWAKLPTNPQAATTQVVLAQEELWVYGVFCDAIARANKDSGGVYNAAIVNVAELALGYPAAQEKPGGMGGARIVMPKSTDAADAGQPPPDMAVPGSPEGGPLSKPSHPRFGGGAAGPLAGAESIPGIEGTPAAAPDASLRDLLRDGNQPGDDDVGRDPAPGLVDSRSRCGLAGRQVEGLLAGGWLAITAAWPAAGPLRRGRFGRWFLGRQHGEPRHRLQVLDRKHVGLRALGELLEQRPVEQRQLRRVGHGRIPPRVDRGGERLSRPLLARGRRFFALDVHGGVTGLTHDRVGPLLSGGRLASHRVDPAPGEPKRRETDHGDEELLAVSEQKVDDRVLVEGDARPLHALTLRPCRRRAGRVGPAAAASVVAGAGGSRPTAAALGKVARPTVPRNSTFTSWLRPAF